MTRFLLAVKSLGYYWRTNLAVLLGVMVGTAVISGALIVGDSIRASLRQMTLDRLGEIDYALSGPRFFREQVANELQQARFPESVREPGITAANESTPVDSTGESVAVAPAILLTGTLRYEPPAEQQSGEAEAPDTAAETAPVLRIAGRVNLIGCDERLWTLLRADEFPLPEDDTVILNQRVAEQLGVAVGESITVFADIPSLIPQESLLGKRDVDEKVIEIRLRVAAIVPAAATAGRFSLQANQQLPLNAFVQLDRLQEELDLAEVRATPRNPVARPARVNALLVRDPAARRELPTPLQVPQLVAGINEPLRSLWAMDDLYVQLRQLPERNYFSLESERMMLEQSLSETALHVAKIENRPTSPVLVYLVNEIHSVRDPAKYSMYSVAAGIELTEAPPFGPLVDTAGQPVLTLAPDEVAINAWLAEDLNVAVGDEVVVKYHVVGSRGELPEVEQTFRVGAVLQLDGSRADDPGFTPFVKGITDAESFGDWEQPFPMQMERITPRDDEYWEQHRATPKLFLPLATARNLWQSRYGDTTSVRIGAAEGEGLADATAAFGPRLLERLPFPSLGLTLQPVKVQGLMAAQGSQDFSGLFIGFSFFVIAAAAVLIALLFQLGMETRTKQIGLLTAVGFSNRQIRGLLLTEGLLIAGLGVALGTVLAVGYASLMIYGLTTWWRDAVGTTFLAVAVTPTSLIVGAAIALVVALPGMGLGIRRVLKILPRARLAGWKEDLKERGTVERSGPGLKLLLGLAILGISILLVAGVLAGLIPATEAFGGFNWHIVSFFLSGFGSLIGSLLIFVAILRKGGRSLIVSRGAVAAGELGIRNLGRNRQRSSVTVVLVALATFVVVAVAAGRQNPVLLEPERYSGNGGFTLVAESARPLLYDPTTAEGQRQLGLTATRDARLRELLAEINMVSFRVRPGEDASCLNLYQTVLPTVLGVPDGMIERGGFLFADTPGANPWELLQGLTADGHIPVLGDQNTLQYSLHKTRGDTIPLPSELSYRPDLEVAGALSGSVFQGVLLMSESNFLKVFPDVSGYHYFLFEVNPADAAELTALLESRFVNIGLDVELVGRRLENFLAVQNTYLSTFQSLGGLGLLLGTFGLGTVMLRNVLERRAELALLRAIGFGQGQLAGIVLAENLALLLSGLAIGTGCGLLAMLPTLSSRAGDVPWSSMLQLLIAVLCFGTLSCLFAIIAAIRTQVLQTLRSE